MTTHFAEAHSLIDSVVVVVSEVVFIVVFADGDKVDVIVVVFDGAPRLLDDVDISSRIGPRNMSW